MMGFGLFEILLLGAVCVVPAVAILGALIWLVISQRKSSGENSDDH
jgi:hypothetical protein